MPSRKIRQPKQPTGPELVNSDNGGGGENTQQTLETAAVLPPTTGETEQDNIPPVESIPGMVEEEDDVSEITSSETNGSLEAEASVMIGPVLKSWMALYQETQHLNAEVRARKKQMRELEITITKFMQSREIPHITSANSGHALVLDVSRRKQAISNKYISGVLESLQCPNELRDTLTKHFVTDRPVVEKVRLKYSNKIPKS